MDNTINQTQQMADLITDRGILIVIASLFFVGVIGMVLYLIYIAKSDRDERRQREEREREDRSRESDKAEARTEKLTQALICSTKATEENTSIYQNTLKMHEKMDEDIEDIKNEMESLKEEMARMKDDLASNQVEMMKSLNKLYERYDRLSVELNEKLDLLLVKAS